MNQIRTFIAVEIPLAIKENIAGLQEKLKREQALIRWVKPGNIHITLKFLGNVEENKIADIAKAVTVAVNQIKPFLVEIAGVGAFPNYRKPKVVWIGAKSDSDLLKLLVRQIDNEVHKLGFEKEKRFFQAHLTFGRVKRLTGIAGVIKKLEQNKNFESGAFTVNEIVVMRSDLKPTGPVYTPLKKIMLKSFNH